MTEAVTGRIAELHTHPIKGCRSVALTRSRLLATGLEHDREWMVVDGEGHFLSQREVPRLATVQVGIEAHGLHLAAEGQGEVQVPDGPGEAVPVQVWRSRVQARTTTSEADAFFTALCGAPVRLVRFDAESRRACNPDIAPEGHTFFSDGYPVLVTNTASLARLNEVIAQAGHVPVPMSRFRPNVVVEGVAADLEDGSARLRLAGGAELDLVKPCDRCEVTTIDQRTGERRPKEPLASLAKIRMAPGGGMVLFGQNGVPRLAGGEAVEISVGESVTFL